MRNRPIENRPQAASLPYFRRCSFAALLGLAVVAALPQPQQPDLPNTLTAISKQASQFWQSAPNFTAHETLEQRFIVRRHPRLHIHLSPPPRGPQYRQRTLQCWYGFTTLRDAPEALVEVRDPSAREALEQALAASDRRKRELIHRFEHDNSRGLAMDVGQIILLFTRARVDQYSFQVTRTATLASDPVWVIIFHQKTGDASLRIQEPGHSLRAPVQGELWVRQSDQLVLRITLMNSRQDGKIAIRDEATVDYAPNPVTAVLPSVATYRRYLNERLYFENISHYADWQPVPTRSLPRSPRPDAA